MYNEITDVFEFIRKSSLSKAVVCGIFVGTIILMNIFLCFCCLVLIICVTCPEELDEELDEDDDLKASHEPYTMV